ncbi:MAG: hypothetical protein E6J12_00570 [Chloroflexi bacterium]|nr:MAG: hypothetical protein E6J12_00570 [Chloroflexota bacterium]
MWGLALICMLIAGAVLGHLPTRASAAAPSLHAATSRMTLAQAPTGLRIAARSAFGQPSSAQSASLQKAKLTAPDAAVGDYFGDSVAVSGSTAVVGAEQKDSGKGAAYVFVRSGMIWSEQAELKAADGAAGDLFGYSVAVSGSTAVVGAVGRSASTGAAYVFVRSGTTWSWQATLTASDGVSGDSFANSVAVSGSIVVAGASNKNSSTGAAYAFLRSGTTWSQQAELTASDGGVFDGFGYSVAVSGSTAVVGAYGRSSAAGAAYVFARSGTTWSQQSELTASDGASGDLFGYSVAISYPIVLVGACCKNSSTGAAYVFAPLGTWSEQAKLTAPDGVSGDHFGSSVALSGTAALVGAYGVSSSKGAAYVFARAANEGTWSLQAKLTAADGAPNDNFGQSVALSGTTPVVGAYGKSSNTGAAYAYTLPSQQARLTASDGVSGDVFGYSVAISGSAAVVGAFAKSGNTGEAYVFVRSGTTWSQQARLIASDGASNDNFGYSVAISGSTAVVGAYQHAAKGAVYVFVRSGTIWTQQAELTAADGVSGDHFGYSVAVSGSTALVGAPAKSLSRGVAYVFLSSGTTWSQQAKLTAADRAQGDSFGNSMAISGSTAVVGASGANGLAGAAYVFVGSGTTWSQQAKLTASDSVPGDYFGYSVAIYGSSAVIGAYNKNSITGAAYAFVRSGATWSEQAKLTASDGASGDSFGWSVAIYGSRAVVGSLNSNFSTGAAYVFVHSGTTWTQQAKLTTLDGEYNDSFGASVALSGSTSVLGAPGTNSNGGAAYVFTLP